MKNIPLIRQFVTIRSFLPTVTEGNNYLSLTQLQVQPDLLWTPRYFLTVGGYSSEWQNSTGGQSIWFATGFYSTVILKIDYSY